jgi:hypothetical protein
MEFGDDRVDFAIRFIQQFPPLLLDFCPCSADLAPRTRRYRAPNTPGIP